MARCIVTSKREAIKELSWIRDTRGIQPRVALTDKRLFLALFHVDVFEVFLAGDESKIDRQAAHTNVSKKERMKWGSGS